MLYFLPYKAFFEVCFSF